MRARVRGHGRQNAQRCRVHDLNRLGPTGNQAEAHRDDHAKRRQPSALAAAIILIVAVFVSVSFVPFSIPNLHLHLDLDVPFRTLRLLSAAAAVAVGVDRRDDDDECGRRVEQEVEAAETDMPPP